MCKFNFIMTESEFNRAREELLENISELFLKKTTEIAPYNDVESYQINTALAKKLGFRFSNINSWIDSLIKDCIKEIIG